MNTSDPRRGFDRIAPLYQRARPSYPAVLFDRLFADLPSAPKMVEVGPGTGQATADLVARGAEVTAIELGSNLAAALTRRFGSSIEVVVGEFETVALEKSRQFDAVVSATAYHWIRGSARLDRPAELLVDGGVLAIIDLIQVGSPVDRGYFDRVQPIYAAFGQDRHDWDPPAYATAQPAIARELRAHPGFDAPRVHRVRWDQTYSSEGYRDLLNTYSGTLAMAPDQAAAMVDQLVAVIDDEYGGVLTRPLVATLTLACRTAG